MLNKILIAGASGALGKEVLKVLNHKKLPIRTLVHTKEGKSNIASISNDIWTVNAENASEISGITKGVSTIISTMGKSVSLFAPEKQSFIEDDFQGNKNLLEDAIKNNVQRFIYISIKGADWLEEFQIAKAHKKFEEALQNSGIKYTIVRPVGFYSGLNDLAIMAKRKIIPIVGNGEAKTNSIHQKDLAEVVAGYLRNGPKIIEIGGPLVHTRLEMAKIIKEKIGGKIIKVPKKIADIITLVPNAISNDFMPKLKYFNYITTHDMLGEKRGSITFRKYIENLDLNQLP